MPENTGHPRRWAILSVLVVSLLVVVLDNTVLNVAMRTIADPVRGLGASQSELAWSINSYTLVFAGLLFTFGVLGDRFGRRRMLMIGLALFGIASLLSAYAQDPTQLIAARAFMGLGGAAIMPATLSIISNVFDPRERGRAIGVWAGAVGLGVAIGPIVGGVLLEHAWWGSVFLINVPIVVVGLVAIAVLVPESRDPKPGRIDYVGVLLTIVGLISLVYGIIYGGDHDFGHWQAWGSIALGVAVLVAFVWYERRVEHPSLDVGLFRIPAFSAAVTAVGMVAFAAFGSMFFMAFYLQLVRGFGPLAAGLSMTPFAVAQLVFAPRSAALVKRYGPKAVCSVGMLVVAIGLAGFIYMGVDTPMWIMYVTAFVMGAGMANVMPPAMESIMSTLPREKAGVGSAVNNVVRQVGSALGVAVIGSMLSSVYRDEMATKVSALPAGARHAAAESVSATYAVAEKLGPAGRVLEDQANHAFVAAMHFAAIGSSLFALLGVLVVLVWLPRRSGAVTPPEPAGPSVGARSMATSGDPDGDGRPLAEVR